MTQVIAGLYEIQERIGSGGSGIVYLGRHLRLEKQVVLKADKRTLSTKTETLRREVDMLKELSHTYIPQVYDFVQEDGVVYTVMDFIEGESLDKLLKRGENMSQPQIIKWSCQLLEALSYLHSRPPYGILHGDIKPANIMLRPNGDICLIDFNIALALGEDGAVKAGYSRGYASPEHYGSDYISGSGTAAQFPDMKSYVQTEEKTLKTGEEKTLLIKENSIHSNRNSLSSDNSNSSGNHGVMLDVRSDIYSLGATLYHLLSGRRPAEKAVEVQPLGADICSPSVSAIIQKAMAPNADMRYQSADEMLNAFLQLYKSDKRVVRHKRRIVVSAVIVSLIFLAGGICSFIGLKQLEQLQTALTLSEYSADALADGDVSSAIKLAVQAIPDEKSIFGVPVTAQAQKALTDALGVYNLSDGFKDLNVLKLPSAPFHIAVSPQGTRLAVVYAYEAAVFEMEDQKKIVTLPIQNSALSDVVFLDETHIVYAGEQGVTAYDLEKQEVQWTGEAATTLAVSADHMTVAAVNRDEDKAIVYCASDGTKAGERSFNGRHMTVAANDIFADPENDIFALNENGRLLAVSFSDGGLTVFDLKHPENDMVIFEKSDYGHFEGGFHGKYFAFTAGKSGDALFTLFDTEKKISIGSCQSQDVFLLQTDEQGIYLASNNLLVSLNPENMEEQELAYTNNVNITAFSKGKEYSAAATDDNCFSFYDKGAHLMSTESCNENCDFVLLAGKYAISGNRSEPSLRLMKLENHSEAQLLSYDAYYEHDEARISQDGRTVMLYSYENFRIYDMEGGLLIQEELPNAEFIYDQQFIRDGEKSWLKVIWYDGTIRCYSASDGSLISEEMGEKPSKDLYEEFYTDKYRIASSLHEAPKVYELKSGRLTAELEEDSYLTYVTQTGNYIITEYISAAGERYGILLNDKFQKLAYLPKLCDVANNMLVFDYESGNLRYCRLYSLQELLALGETYLTKYEGKEDFKK